MSNYKKADHRLVQPRPEHYKDRVNNDGKTEQVLCGPYSLEQRDQFFEVTISMYLTRHPKQKRKDARRAAFQKWRNLVFSTIGDEYVAVADPKKAKDKVKVFK